MKIKPLFIIIFYIIFIGGIIITMPQTSKLLMSNPALFINYICLLILLFLTAEPLDIQKEENIKLKKQVIIKLK